MTRIDRSEDPYVGFLFTVEVSPGSLPGAGNVARVGGFSDVSGLNFENEVETLRVGGVNHTEVMLPGPARFPTRLVLKRGLADRTFLWAWYLAVMEGRIARREVTIAVRDPTHKTRQSWIFKEACPVKWTGPELHAVNSAVSFESIELIHRGLQRAR
jgi:phage tail-like protein